MTAANKPILALFSGTLFLSAALMFGLQPMIGKMLLPIVGGTPAGWIVAMAFFQMALLVGYFVAHALSQLEPRKQGILYIACLGLGLFFLPAQLTGHDVVSDHPGPWDVFMLLTCVVAVPFIALSATASTLQRLFMTTDHTAAKDPYFLYAASNLGSFAGLLLYPFAVEPYSTLTFQSQAWLGGYVLLMALAAACLMMSGKQAEKQKTAHKSSVPISWQQRLEWIGLAFIPSGLMLAVTTHITTDVFSIPLVWVIPLSIYLLTFVIAFSRKSVVPYQWVLKAQPVAAAIAAAFTFLIAGAMTVTWYAFLLHFVAFGIIALMCHMRLARSRPGDNPRHLTEFYLMLSIGGALGGVLNAFVVPVIFDRLVEYPVFLLASVLCNENIRKKLSSPEIYIFLAGCALTGVVAILQKKDVISAQQRDFALIVIFALLTVNPRAFLAVGLVSFGFITLHLMQQPPLLTERNFYGVLKVYERPGNVAPNLAKLTRFLQHGTTLHGNQILDLEYEKTPTTYYTRQGPLGALMETFKPRSVAAVGLGTGSINCYSAPDRKVVFFEIDPDVEKIAETQFTYLSNCGTGMPRVIIGDARLEMQKLEGDKFDLIILDAFSSDTIPTHLLTKEAIDVYLDRLTAKGIIAFHISNRYFLLDGPIAAAGNDLGLKNAVVLNNVPGPGYAATSRWIVLARQDVDLVPLAKHGWVRAVVQDPTLKAWTDDYTNLLRVLNFNQ